MKTTNAKPSTKVPGSDNKPGSVPVAFVTQAVVIPQGDGSFLYKPGRPVSRLTVLQFAQAIGVKSRSSVYQQIGSDALPERMIYRCGPRTILIDAGAVAHYLDYWRTHRDGGVAPVRLTPRA